MRGQERPLPGSPEHPIPLLPELADFLKDQEVACLAQATDQGTVYVVKLPRVEIEKLRGAIPILVRHELYAHPAAPVIRTIIRLYDQPDSSLALETFTNIADEQQQADFQTLSQQNQFGLLFYDESLTHHLSKVVGHHNPEELVRLLSTAQSLLTVIPKDQFDFDLAKHDVVERTEL